MKEDFVQFPDLKTLVQQLNAEISRRNISVNQISIEDQTSENWIGTEAILALNSKRREVANKKATYVVNATCSGHQKWTDSSYYTGSDLTTTVINAGETTLGVENEIWYSQYDQIRADILALKNTCGCNAYYRPDYDCSSDDETCPSDNVYCDTQACTCVGHENECTQCSCNQQCGCHGHSCTCVAHTCTCDNNTGCTCNDDNTCTCNIHRCSAYQACSETTCPCNGHTCPNCVESSTCGCNGHEDVRTPCNCNAHKKTTKDCGCDNTCTNCTCHTNSPTQACDCNATCTNCNCHTNDPEIWCSITCNNCNHTGRKTCSCNTTCATCTECACNSETCSGYSACTCESVRCPTDGPYSGSYCGTNMICQEATCTCNSGNCGSVCSCESYTSACSHTNSCPVNCSCNTQCSCNAANNSYATCPCNDTCDDCDCNSHSNTKTCDCNDTCDNCSCNLNCGTNKVCNCNSANACIQTLCTCESGHNAICDCDGHDTCSCESGNCGVCTCESYHPESCNCNSGNCTSHSICATYKKETCTVCPCVAYSCTCQTTTPCDHAAWCREDCTCNSERTDCGCYIEGSCTCNNNEGCTCNSDYCTCNKVCVQFITTAKDNQGNPTTCNCHNNYNMDL